MTSINTNTINSVFQGRSFLAEKDFTPAELQYLIDFGLHLKHLAHHNIFPHYLTGLNIALLFEKASTRTRAAFTTAAIELGAHPEYLGTNDIQLGSKESIEDTAIVLGCMFDGIEFRGFKQSDVNELAKYSGVPVWNGLTDDWHPTQMIADFMTIKENFGHLHGLKLAYVGDGRNNVAKSLLITGSMLGVEVHIIAPKELQPPADVIQLAYQLAQPTKVQPVISDNLTVGVKNANIIYTDVWVSMGETDWQERVALLKPYQVNMELLELTQNTSEKLIFLHCLPAFHDTNTEYGATVNADYGITAMEVTDEVFRSKYARQWQQAENRKHAIKAIMAATLGNLFIPKVPDL